MKWEKKEIEFLPIDIIDGDRGVNYPKLNEFYEKEYCLFLNTGNVTLTGFDFSKCQFINIEKDEKLRKGKLKRNDIVLTTRGTLGNSGFYSDNISLENIRINSGMVIIRSKDTKELDPFFIYYSIRENNFQTQIANSRSGSAQPQIPIGTLKKLKLSKPALPTQRKIASILSAYDDLIENNLKRIKLLEEAAKISFKLLVNSETVNDVSILDICYVTDGTHDSPKQQEEGFYLITGKHLINGFIDFATAYCISEADHYKIQKRSRVVNGDVILSNIGTLGNVAIIDSPFEFSVKNVIIFKPSADIYSELIYCYLQSDEMQTRFQQESSGTSQKFLSLKYARDLRIKLPSENDLKEFHYSVSKFLKMKSVLNQQNTKLREARDILLPRLMNGEIEV